MSWKLDSYQDYVKFPEVKKKKEIKLVEKWKKGYEHGTQGVDNSGYLIQGTWDLESY